MTTAAIVAAGVKDSMVGTVTEDEGVAAAEGTIMEEEDMGAGRLEKVGATIRAGGVAAATTETTEVAAEEVKASPVEAREVEEVGEGGTATTEAEGAGAGDTTPPTTEDNLLSSRRS